MDKMPSTVKVGPHLYSIIRKPASALPDALGTCDFQLLQICIRQRMRRSKAQETLLHEILHSATHPTVNCSDKRDDEEFVTAIAPVLLGVLKDNPDLVGYLTR